MAIVTTILERGRRFGTTVREWPPKSWLVASLVAVCTALIVYCRVGLNVSIVSTHFAYLPIVLVGLWWGRRAVWIAAAFGVLIVCVGPLTRTEEPLADLKMPRMGGLELIEKRPFQPWQSKIEV
jgi:hypothetical protein